MAVQLTHEQMDSSDIRFNDASQAAELLIGMYGQPRESKEAAWGLVEEILAKHGEEGQRVWQTTKALVAACAPEYIATITEHFLVTRQTAYAAELAEEAGARADRFLRLGKPALKSAQRHGVTNIF